MWCLIVLIPDLCPLSYFSKCKKVAYSNTGCNQILKPYTCFYVKIKAFTTYDSNMFLTVLDLMQKIFIQSDLCLHPLVQIGKTFQHKIANVFLSIRYYICFGCSKEPSHRDGSFNYPQHMFWLRNKKNIF